MGLLSPLGSHEQAGHLLRRRQAGQSHRWQAAQLADELGGHGEALALGLVALVESHAGGHVIGAASLFRRRAERLERRTARLSALGTLAADLAGGQPVPLRTFVALVGGFALFVPAALALAVWIFERKDY